MDQLQSFDQFEGIRKHADENGEIWYAVVDVIAVVAEPRDPSKYWSDMKARDASQELSAICGKFPILHRTNGRRYKMECATQQGILQIVQHIPSPNAIPFRQWLAMTGSRRLDEIAANRSIEMERERLLALGFHPSEIAVRLESYRKRGELSGEWFSRGVEVLRKS